MRRQRRRWSGSRPRRSAGDGRSGERLRGAPALERRPARPGPDHHASPRRSRPRLPAESDASALADSCCGAQADSCGISSIDLLNLYGSPDPATGGVGYCDRTSIGACCTC